VTSPSRWTRRSVLFSLAPLAARSVFSKGRTFPADRRRFTDPSTEFEITRLTDPSYTSLLPPVYGRAVSRHGAFVVFSCDRTGSPQAFRLDLKTGEQHQLTDAAALLPATLTLLPDEHSILYFDGAALQRTALANLRSRPLYRLPEGCQLGSGFSVSDDGQYGCLVEIQAGVHRLKLLSLARGTATTVIESKGNVSTPLPRPRRAGLLYRRGGDRLALVNFDGRDDRTLNTAPGGIGTYQWSADGRTVLYLRIPSDPKILREIRELTPDTNTDRLIAPTSQFATFSRNSDASVFVGASLSKASPHLLILLRLTRRELTLCEHRSSDPASTAPIFTPDSQRVVFQSDEHGKPALFTMSIEKLVANTEA
jgi:oligogalacturonide lyase